MKYRSYYLRRYTLVATLLWLSLLVTGVFYTQAQSTSIKINFQDGGDAPTGYEADNGDAYGVRSNGETYGWRNADTDAPIDASGNARKRGSGSITLTNTLMHLRYNECCSGNGLNVPVYWEIALPNGTYNVTVSVGDSSNDTQPTVHILTAEGVVITDGSAGKTPAEYPTQQVTVTDGALTLDQGTGGFNTKINYVEIDFVDAAPPLALFDVMVNFQASQEAPDGYLADYGDAYGTRSNGETYGWRSVNTGAPFDASANARNRDGNANITLANTLMHLRYNECCSNGSNGTQEPVYWEIEVPNGTYNVLVSLGDANPENTGATAHSITAEDIVLGGAEVAPTEYLAQPITVTDGALTIDQAPNGFNTKINYIEISSTGVALTPAITSTDPLNGATNVSLTTAISANVFLPTDGQGVDPATLTDPNAAGHPSATDTVRLIEMSNGQEGPQVPLNSVNTSGGNDVIVATPAQNLKPLTTYKFVVDGVQDLAGATFDFYEGTFTTGLDNSGGGGSTKVKFTSTEVVPNGAHTSLAIGPDGRFYATTIMGVLRIWDINQDGTLTNLREFDPSPITGRAVIGLEFDPTSTPGNPIIWVTHSEGGNTIRGGGGKHFTSSIAILTVENHDTASENWTGRDVIVGLPRSHKDHLSNSLELGPDGALYMTQGSISGMGDQDSGWGNEPETLLSAAVLRIDRAAILSASANDLPIDVATGIPNSNGDLYTGGGTGETDPNLMLPNFGLNDPGLAANGLYDPLAPNAPVTIFATGLRNAYDLLWHSNGHLYSATNGSATGSARTPATPANVNDLPQCQSRINGEPYPNDIPAVETLFRPPTQPDLFFRVVEGVYYGHPNPTRCEWVLNGGDPAGDIVARVSQYADGTNPDPNYAPFNGGDIYNLGNNWSPNGTIEYTSNTFGGALRGTVMVVRYSGGDDILVMNVDSNGDFVRNNERSLEDENGNVLRFESPLDLVEDTTNGNIYVSAYSGTRIYLLRPFGSQVTPEGEILLSDGPIIFEEGLNESGTYDPVANPRNVTITNNGNGTLNLTSIELSGANADKYELPNSLPTEVAPNSSVDVAVTFNPTEEGVAVASFDVVSDDPFTPNASVELRGLGKDGFDGSDEPSLQLILDTFGFGIDVGDDFPLTTPLHSSLNSGNTDTVFGNQEVEAPSFVKAGDGDVTIEVIAAYGPRNGSYEIGWYTAGNPDSKQLLQDLSANPNTNMNRLLPALNGSNSFDPGTTRFGFFNHWTTFDKPNSPYYIYTEEDLNTNTNEGTPIDNYVRTYPMPGEVNTYVVAIEEVPRGFDYQDFVFIVRNVVPVVPGDGQLAVSPDRLIFDNVSSSSNEDEGASAAQTITINNPGSGVLSLTDISLTGSGAGEFEFAGNLPGFVLPGESETISVVFDPASVGLFTASVGITSDAASNGIVSVELRGLGKKGFGGGDEPSLQQVLDTYDIPVNVGDDDPSTNVIHSQSAQQSAALLGDEVEIQLFLPIGNGEVEIELLSVYGPNDNPVTMVGWYDGFTKAETELLRVSNGSHQTLNPVFTGSTSFAPVGPFGFYSQWPFFNDRKLYSEDTLNTFNGAIPHHVRVYELPGEANAYVVATEEHISGFDFQDVVFIVRNVEPAGASGEINLVNLDWDKPGTNNDLMGQNIPELDYLNRWLTMSSLNNNVNQHEVKDTARLLIENTSQTEPLVITALTISDTSEFDFYAEGNIQPPTLPLTIEPGDTYDLWIEFVHQGNNGTKGILYQETLTIVSTAENEPVIEVVLAGGWQGGPEGGREIDTDEVAGAFGFVPDSEGRPIQPLSSEYTARNDEILSFYWRRADTDKPVYVRQLAAYHGCYSAVGFGIQGSGGFTHEGDFCQSLLPTSNGNDDALDVYTNPAERLYNSTNSTFSIQAAGYSTDECEGETLCNNHGMRLWPIYNPDGELVPNVYFAIQDYTQGGCGAGSANCDYNDNMYVITNIEPVTQPDPSLQIAMTTETPEVTINQVFDYTVTVSNDTIFAVDNVEVTYTLPDGFSLVSGTFEGGTCAAANGAVTCDMGTLGGKAVVDIDLTVTAANEAFGVVSNATVTADGFDGATSEDVLVDVFDPENIPGSITVVLDAVPDSETPFSFTTDIDNAPFTLTDDGSTVGGDALQINFNEETGQQPDGYELDYGLPYGDRGNGLEYGWVDAADGVTPLDLTGGNRGNGRDRGTSQADQRLDSLIHMQGDDVQNFTGVAIEGVWEIAVADGTYEVTVGAGDPDNNNYSTNPEFHAINVEGEPAIAPFAPSGGAGADTKNQTGTVTVEVADGKLTIDAFGGTNTKINYVDIVSLTLDNQQVFEPILKGDYTITQATLPAWTLEDITCDAQLFNVDGATVTVNLQPDEDVTCTFTNEAFATPTINPISDQVVEAGTQLTVPLMITAPEGEGVEGETISATGVDFAGEVVPAQNTDGTQYEVTFSPGIDDVGEYEITVFAELFLAGSTTETFTLTVTPSGDAPCSPISTLPCDQVAVNVPFELTFDGTEGGMVDGSDVGTGFTMVDPPSARLTGNNSPFDAPFDENTPGYEPSRLSVDGGALTITSTKGIQFNQPSGTPSSTQTNSQINAMGVGYDATGRVVIQTSLEAPAFSSSNGNNSQQAGLWFGLGEDEYVKLVVSKTGTNSSKVQLFVEDIPNHDGFDELNSGNFTTQAITLRMQLDPTTGVVRGFYSLDGGITFIQLENSELTLPAKFFEGLDHDANPTTDPLSYAGIFTTQRRAAVNQSIDFVFNDFSINRVVEQPTITAVRPADGATDVFINTGVAVDLNLPNAGFGVDESSLTVDNVYLQAVGSSDKIPANLGTSGGGDVIVLQPLSDLQPFTEYVFVIDGATDLTGTAFVPFMSMFTTGEDTEGGEYEGPIEFTQSVQATGAGYTTLTVGPDGKLYASTNNGEIHRFDIEADGSLTNKQVITSLQDAEGGNRLLIGLAFDPASTSNNLILWASHTTYGFSGMADWGGKITRLSGENLETVEDVVVNLPRSIRDHVTNGLDFGPDGALYVTQGSNSAMGAPDGAWGNRPERALSAAVLRIDTASINGPLDVKTEDGGNYDPFAPNAPVTVFAAGVRNAYDLVWHTNGDLYVPTNGSAAGGATPASTDAACDSYSGPAVEAISRVNQTQNDYLFRVDPAVGGYFGHPNPILCNFVLNGGNPTGGADPAQVNQYAEGTQPDDEYKGFAFNFELNKSPNGVIEYRSNVFGGALQGTLMVVRYSQKDDIIVLTPGSDGDIDESLENITGFTGFSNPLDLTEGFNGNIYVAAYGGSGEIILLKPADQTQQPDPATLTVTLDAQPDSDRGFDFTVTGDGYSQSFTLTDGGNSAPNDFSANVNFNAANGVQPDGYELDYGLPYGDRGNGLTYGWVAASDGVTPLDLTAVGAGNGRDRETSQADQRLDTLMHVQGNDVNNFSGVAVEGVWEIAVPNGTYEVTVAAGDPSDQNYNNNPELHSLTVEDVQAVAPFAPPGNTGSNAQHQSGTVTVNVTDGKLTIDARDGTNTKINYVDITGISASGGVNSVTLPDLTPGTYTITQTTPAGWVFIGLTCGDVSLPVSEATVSLNMASGITTECVFKNGEESDQQPNVPPVITALSEAPTMIAGETEVVEIPVFDADGDALNLSLNIDSSVNFLTPNIIENSVGDYVYELTFSPDESLEGEYLIGVNADDGINPQVSYQFTLTVEGLPPADDPACSPISTLPCGVIGVNLPFALGFDGTEGGLEDGSTPTPFGTGFTMAMEPSARLAGDNPVTFPDVVEGYEPRFLTVANGNLSIAATKGIFYRDPGESSDTNSQLNALGVGFDATDTVIIETTLTGVDLAPNGNNAQQGGIWFGLDEDNVVKLVMAKTSDTSAKIQLQVEDYLTSPNAVPAELDSGSVMPLTQDVTLRMVLDPETNSVTGFYSTDGVTFTQVIDGGVDSLTMNAAFFAGADHDSDAQTAPLSYAGVFGTTRRGNNPINFNFADFSIDYVNPPANTPPVAVAQGDVETTTNTPVDIVLQGTDADLADELTFSIGTQPTNGVLNIDNLPTVTYTPNADYFGPDSFTFIVNDGEADSDPALVEITVTEPNNPPVAIAPLQSVEVDENSSVEIVLEGSDADVDDVLTFSIGTQPTNGVLNTDNLPTVTYTPNADYFGPDSFTFTVNDGSVDSAVATVNITVNEVNIAPVAIADSVQVDENTSVEITLTGVDADTDTLTYAIGTQPTNGVLNIDNLPTVTYTPNADYFGPDSFTFTVNDGSVDSAVATVSITVNEVNVLPVANAQSVTVDENTSVEITLTGSDTDQDTLTFSIGAQPANGTLNIDNLPTVTYTPDADYSGPDSFTFTVNDGNNDSAPATVSITVNDVNAPPVLGDAADITKDEGELVVFAIITSDETPATVTLSLSMVDGNNAPVNFGQFNDNGNGTGSFVWLTDASTVDADMTFTATITATDDQGQSDTDTVLITIVNVPVDNAPEIDPIGTVNVDEGGDIALTISASDDDEVNDDISFSISIPGLFGYNFVDNNDGTASLTMTTADGDDGIYTATVTATDTAGNSDTGQFTINIKNVPVDAAPQIAEINDFSVTEGDIINLPVSATDNDEVADAVTLTIDISGVNPDEYIFNANSGNGVLIWQPFGVGSYNATVTAMDTAGNTDTEGFVITVEADANATPTPTEPPNSQEIIRINAGGPAVTTESGDWMADTYHNGGVANSGLTNSVNAAQDEIIYLSERSANSNSTGFSYAIPVSNDGDHTVRLHFAEIWFTGENSYRAAEVGERVFDVEVEGQTMLDNLDLIGTVGPATAYVYEFEMPITDGTLNISFPAATANRPTISGIEVVGPEVVEPTPTEPTPTEPTPTEPTPTEPTPTDPPPPVDAIRINAGGPPVTTDTGAWGADQYFVGGKSNDLADSVNAAQDEEIYFTERSCGADKGGFAYAIPIENGDYEVNLHFAELWWNGAGNGNRLFSVEIEGQTVLFNFDPAAAAGDVLTAHIETFEVSVADGVLDINFPPAAEDCGTISGIEVVEADGQVEPTPTEPTPTEPTPTEPTPTEPTPTEPTPTEPTPTEPTPTEPTPTEPPADAIRINAGGPAVTTDTGAWGADEHFNGGKATELATSVNAAQDEEIYFTERSATTDNGSFSYAIPVDDGTYDVNLHFAEIWFTGQSGQGTAGVGQRVFSVAIEGSTVLTDFDPTDAAGGALTAHVETFTVTVSDGVLNINFPTATVNRPTLSGIEVIESDSQAEPTPTEPTPTEPTPTEPTPTEPTPTEPTPTEPTPTEPATVCDGLVRVADDAELSGAFTTKTVNGETHVHAPENVGDFYDTVPEQHTATFCFTVETAGTYQINTLVDAPDGASDSFWVSVEGSDEWALWDTQQGTMQDYVNSRDVADPLQLDLPAGEVSIVFALREDNTGLAEVELELVEAEPTPTEPTPTEPTPTEPTPTEPTEEPSGIISSLTLIDASGPNISQDAELLDINDGAVIDLATLPNHNQFNFRVNTDPQDPGSMEFFHNGTFVHGGENNYPFAICCNSSNNYNGMPMAYLAPGEHTVMVKLFAGDNSSGGLIETVEFNYTVVDNTAAQQSAPEVSIPVAPVEPAAAAQPAVAMASLEVSATCAGAGEMGWMVQNANATAVQFDWELYGSGQSGTLVVEASSQTTWTTPLEGDASTVVVTVGDVPHGAASWSEGVCGSDIVVEEGVVTEGLSVAPAQPAEETGQSEAVEEAPALEVEVIQPGVAEVVTEPEPVAETPEVTEPPAEETPVEQGSETPAPATEETAASAEPVAVETEEPMETPAPVVEEPVEEVVEPAAPVVEQGGGEVSAPAASSAEDGTIADAEG